MATRFILSKLKDELSPSLTYHSVTHTEDVYDAARYIALKERVATADCTILLSAVLFHDTGFLVQPKDHELLSCAIAREKLPLFEYNTKEIEQVCELIMATRLPQTPENLLEKIICDADLDYLGRDDFFIISHKLYLEMINLGTVKSLREYNDLQIHFLETHRYFTDTAIKLRAQKKEEHLKRLKQNNKSNKNI
ncbi:HD domain-containing protein [Olivibacter sp. SDN3]|uniref:HD domain-containing protein n=1 Tax=Olivibacter sp. SDN3 TaxID=2764720 RepID=UPI0016517CD1|nr:HD domain-containing protein [Olivibacter sp. SDN3]QNL52323.1 HD domain-containing protein [Olivibacter sp. SDN3]